MPIYNPAGKYLVKLTFNGIPRKILVDDRIPLSKDGRPMCSHSSHAEELWVSIIEKAYMKVARTLRPVRYIAHVALHT